ncbi:MAG: hypothetical protein WBO55_11020 [Rhizobiaceae bacterium]
MPRITLDLDDLVAKGKLSPEEAERLSSLAVTGGGLTILIQALTILGALAMAAGVIVLKPDPTTGMVLAVLALGFATYLHYAWRDSLWVLASGIAIAGTFGLAGSLAMQMDGVLPAMGINALATLIFLAAALVFQSRFLIAFVPLGIAAILGSNTAYWHAAYAIFVREPTLTALAFAVLAIGLFAASPRLGSIAAGMATVAARMSWIIMNFGFWVGSLWGDYVGEHFMVTGDSWDQNREALKAWREVALFIPDYMFVIAWALASVATIILFRNNRFAVNASITFLAINAYTQFFERFADNPLTLILGGASLLLFAFGLFHFDRWASARRQEQ